MTTIFAVHLAAVFCAPAAIKLFKSYGFLLLAAVPALCSLWVMHQLPSVNYNPRYEFLSWIPQLQLNIQFQLNSLSVVFALLILVIGTLVLLYCAWYFVGSNSDRLGLFAAEMVGFCGVMFALVTSGNTLFMFIMWETTSVLSFLLIGYYPERALSRRAAAQSLLVTTLGGLAMLCGVIMIGTKLHTYTLNEWIHHAELTPGLLQQQSVYTQCAVALILIGAFSKSALMPFHFWLPDAMAAPTPVSAFLHSAAMVKAGIFLIAVLGLIFSHDSMWRFIIGIVGLTTMVLGGWFSLQKYDLKLILAYGTISQLGFITTAIGFGGPLFAQAGLAMVVAHAFFKSTLFMVVGIIDHATRTRDIRKIAGLGKEMPVLMVLSAVACISMVGLPPTLGYLAKEAILHAAMEEPGSTRYYLLAGFIVGSMFTVAYTIRFFYGAFGQKGRRTSVSVQRMHHPQRGFYIAPTITAVACVVLALVPHMMTELTYPYGALAQTLSLTASNTHPEHLQLFHGFSIELLFTAIILVGGVLVSRYRYVITMLYKQLLRLIPRAVRTENAAEIYDNSLMNLDVFATKSTRFFQRGSLPLTLSIIFITLSLLTLGVFSTSKEIAVPHFYSNWFTAFVSAMICMSAIAATRLQNRLAGILVIGATGYGCVVFFTLEGAPDLALTQAAVESLMLIFFVLGVRNFGAELATDRIQGRRILRAVIGGLVGLTTVVVAIISTGARNVEPIYQRLPSAAYLFAHGKNTVNVILVDIRAWDTFWETTVLILAGTGVVSLVFRNRRYGVAPKVINALEFSFPENPQEKDRNFWLASSRIRNPKNRSVIMEVTTRLVFPSLMMFSLYLLFAGHNHPGGGFAGGLIAGSSIALRYIAGGRFELGEAIGLEPGYLLGGGMLLGSSNAIIPLFFSHPLFTSHMWHTNLPGFGEITLVSPFFFDLGVYLIVIGVVVDILRSLGARLDLESAIALHHDNERARRLAKFFSSSLPSNVKGRK